MGLDAVILTELLRGAGRIEVTERDEGDAVNLAEPAKDLLEHELRLAVGIDRLLGQRLVDRHRLGDAEGGAGRGEDEALHPLGHHGLKQVHAVRHVVAEVLARIGHRLADERVGGEVHDGLGLRLMQGQLDRLDVGEIPLEEGRPRVDGEPVPLGEVVKDGHGVAGIQELLDADAADVAGSAGDQDGFHAFSLKSRAVA